MRATLAFNGLNEQNGVHRVTNSPLVTSSPTMSVAFISQNLYVMCALFLRTREEKTGKFQVYKGYTKMYLHKTLQDI